MPCYRWDRVIIVPRDHELASLDRAPTLEDLARFPLVTYVFSFEGGSSLKRAFAARDLEPKVVFTARDADVIKTYVRLGMGIGVVAGVAQDCEDQDTLKAIEVPGLFPRCTTWIGFRRDTVLRKYMYDFIELFAGHLDERTVREAQQQESQQGVDQLLAHVELPLKGRCKGTVEDAA